MSESSGEALITEGCSRLSSAKQNGLKVNIKETARDLGISYGTLRNRFLNLCKTREEAHTEQQFLSPPQENTLVRWLRYLGRSARPVSKQGIRTRAQTLHPENTMPSRNWVQLFLNRHPDITLSSATGLDPKRAKAFNEPVVNRFFDKLTKLVEEYDIPDENIYNMDEKGCQRGGGKKGSQRKYVYSRKQRARYKQRSANLELITVLETVCADGEALKPCFVFPGASFCPEWFDDNPEVV
jgi:hypothetical protein